jgi:rhodanese-related sulfurtransferase
VADILNTPVVERPLLLDVRAANEFLAGHIPNAINVPIDELRLRLNELPHDRPIACYCQVGHRGYLAMRILRHAGFEAANISGGYTTYKLWRPTTA